MPIYEYECSKCGLQFELIRPISAANEEIYCPSCRSTQVQKLFSAFACKGSKEIIANSTASCPSTPGRFT